MATQASEAVGARTGTHALAKLVDRWIWAFTAALFFVTVLVGFIPDSIGLLNTLSAGERPPLSGFAHFHAVMMGTWIVLLLAQTSLMATDNRSLHMKLGLVAVVIAPAVVISMVGVSGASFLKLATWPDGMATPELVSDYKVGETNILLEQIRMAVLFPALVIWALMVRREDPDTHKRLFFVATVGPLSAAIDRITWLPTTWPDSPLSLYVTELIWLSPLLIYDLWRRGRLHKAWVIGIAVHVPFAVFSMSVWGTDWWLETAPKLYGIQNW